MNNKPILALAIAGALPGAADASVYNMVLTQVLQYSNGGTAGTAQNISSSTATFTYDDVTNLVAQSGGTFNARVTTAPTTTLYRTLITGLVMGNGGAASAASYSCVEGNFGGGVGASICGNYTFGANFFSESTTTWGPGTATFRTMGGDDAPSGPQQSIASLNGMATISWVGTTLVLANKTCTGICTITASGFNNGQQWTFNSAPIPIPAAAWLFGGALGVLGWMRRQRPA